MAQIIVRPLTYQQALSICADHPHAPAVPKSAKYYIAGYLGKRLCGLAIWGWGIDPRKTPQHLFNNHITGIANYLELCRFFVYDWCPKNTASAFLCATHRILKKYCPQLDYLYTYAAGFQGLIGTIYQASNYKYIGAVPCTNFVYIPSVGLLHPIALWHRYNTPNLSFMQTIYPDAVLWRGYNFRYIYFLCNSHRYAELMRNANFQIIKKYPTQNDIRIWTVDGRGNKKQVNIDFAKTVPVVSLKARGSGVNSSISISQIEGGGAMPTEPLQKLKAVKVG